MSDIMDYIRNPKRYENDPDGNLLSLEPWDENIARQRATEEDIQLTPQHMDVIHFLREEFRQHGQADNGRDLFTSLTDRFSTQGGKKYLFSLFPRGPIMQGCKIAGLPVPPNSADPSFGSVH